MPTTKQDEKLRQAKELLTHLNLDTPQRNDRSAWVFLALANIKPTDSWPDASNPMLTTFQIMEFIRNQYGKDYKPNSRETIRRQTLHQFEQARIVNRNQDNPERPTNSKDNNYCLTQPILEILAEYPDGEWKTAADAFLAQQRALAEQYERQLDHHRVPVRLPSGEELKLSPGEHNELHAEIIHEFCPRFVGGAGVVLYLGDTGSSRNEGGKLLYHQNEHLEALGFPSLSHDKLPDIVVHDTERNWLFLIEAVTSHGPVSKKRWIELEDAIAETCTADRVYVSAFPTRAEFRRHAADIAWETEVWIAEDPDHMIHFNGDRFLGPY